MNDPAGIALMIGMVELATSDHASLLIVGREFAVEMVIGAAFGLIGARLIVPMLARAHLPSEGLYPVLALVLAFMLYGAASVAHGSGFLAVFLAGLAVGHARLPYKWAIERFQGALAARRTRRVPRLGLTVRVSDLGVRDWLEGLALFVALAVVIPPIVVAVTLAGVRMSRAKKAFIAFSGPKGAVPVLLAAFAIIGRAPDADRIYGLVFIAVLASVLAQGTLVPSLARQLGIPMHLQDRLPWELPVRIGSVWTVSAPSELRPVTMASVELGCVEKVVGYPPLSEMDDQQRRESTRRYSTRTTSRMCRLGLKLVKPGSLLDVRALARLSGGL